MSEWWPRIVIFVLLAIVLGVPMAFQPAQATRGVDATGPRLIIYSPHNEQIRFEFARAFNEYRQSRGLDPIVFDWRAAGGTTDIRKKIISEFEAKIAQGRQAEGIGADLFFGGGEYEHNKLAVGIKSGDGVVHMTEPIRLPDGMLEQVFPQPRIGGERLYDEQNLSWVGAALSSFGIVHNRDVLSQLDIDVPTTWKDLADPRYRHWIALSDPGHSGSIAATYNTIVRRMGWVEGWRTLRRVYANARYFTSSSTKVPVDVSAGEAAAGMCIDFYGRFQAGAIMAGGGDRIGYVDPPRMTAITADPITILRGAPSGELANDFVIWLLSPDGQCLWQRRVGSPGGPAKYELRRLPVRQDVYHDDQMRYWTDHVKPFDIAESFPERVPDYYGTIKTISHAIAIDIHDDLVAAWTAINQHRDHPQCDKMLELFDAMPPVLSPDEPDGRFVDALLTRWRNDPDQELRDRLEWTMFFRGNYRHIIEMAR
jgi:ABC-type Fe3+ transport system substrate-binding protein